MCSSFVSCESSHNLKCVSHLKYGKIRCYIRSYKKDILTMPVKCLTGKKRKRSKYHFEQLKNVRPYSLWWFLVFGLWWSMMAYDGLWWPMMIGPTGHTLETFIKFICGLHLEIQFCEFRWLELVVKDLSIKPRFPLSWLFVTFVFFFSRSAFAHLDRWFSTELPLRGRGGAAKLGFFILQTIVGPI